MRQYLKALEDTGAFPQLPDEAGSPEPQPQAKEWVLFYLTQHHDKLGETGDSSVLIPSHSAVCQRGQTQVVNALQVSGS